MGPNRSQRMQSINGVTNNSITFTYILMATAEGEYSIPGATITADGNQMVSNSVKLKFFLRIKPGIRQMAKELHRLAIKVERLPLFLTKTYL